MFRDLFNAIFGVMEELAEAYGNALRRHKTFAAIFTVVYAAFVFGFVFRPDLAKMWASITGETRTQQQIKALETDLMKQRTIAETLASRVKKASFLRNLEFQETWRNDESRAEILRLLDYADFAIQKDDYSRARKLYEEASQIQDTLSVPYYLGRLSYMQGDLSESEANWRQVIKLDAKAQYPEIRLYLGITLYEMGREREGKEVLRDYLSESAR
jgi:tetratricopeptide (TPR) repeat protein